MIGTVEQRFWAKVDRSAGLFGCWPWQGWIKVDGYAEIRPGHQRVHRVSYEMVNGPVPKGLELDHICHNQDLSCIGGVTCRHRRCVNPAHLEATTHRQNAVRSRGLGARAFARFCARGHPFDAANTFHRHRPGKFPTRECRTCRATAPSRSTSLRKAA